MGIRSETSGTREMMGVRPTSVGRVKIEASHGLGTVVRCSGTWYT
eukprot:SAG11_NODE_16358_length_549_cov_7.573333_1_plen_45_part_00